MKNIIFIFFIVLSVFSAFADDLGKKPNFRSIKTTVYEAVLEDTVWKPGAVVDHVVYERFNPNGNKIAEYKIDGETLVEAKRIFYYNEEDRLVKIQTYNKDAELSSTTEYKYGNNGKIDQVSVQSFFIDTLLTSGYMLFWKYDEKQRLISERKTTRQNELIETRTYKYNDDAHTKECVVKVSTGRILGRLISKYNDRNEVVLEKSTGETEEQRMTRTYQYQYDAFGNWIVRDEYTDGEKEYIVKRDIDYGFNDTDWERLTLKGKVKSVRQTSYVAIPRGKEILRGNKKGMFVDYDFNRNGKIISETLYSDAGIVQKTIKKEYDPDGTLMKEVYFRRDGSRDGYAVYLYGKDKVLRYKSVYDMNDIPKSKTAYKYDAEGNLVKELAYDKSGNLFLEFDNLYNAYGQLVERSSPIHPKEDGIYNKMMRIYNFQGKVELESVYLPSGTLQSNCSYKYATSGQVVSGTTCNPGSAVVNYKYKFYNDEQGNWKKRIKFVDDIATVYEERVYTYYEN